LTFRRLLALPTMAAIAVGTGDLRADFPNVFEANNPVTLRNFVPDLWQRAALLTKCTTC
jgi:hypothetical protein